MKTFKITRLFTGEDGQSHFEEMPTLLNEAAIGYLSGEIPVSKMLVGEVENAEWIGWHNPPQSQYVMMLNGSMEIEIGSGERRILKQGEILLADDVTGQGHNTRGIGEGPFRYLAVVV